MKTVGLVYPEPRTRTYESLIHFCIFCGARVRAYYTLRFASLYFSCTSLIRPPYDQPFPLLLYVLFLTAEVPVVLPSAHHIYFDVLTSSALSLGSHRQFRASLLSIYRAPSLHLCDSITSLRHFFITTLLSFLILIDVTSCATSCLSPPALPVFFYSTQSALSVRMHRIRSSLCLEPTRVSLFSPFRCIHLFSPLLSQLVTSRCSPSSSLFPSVPVLVRLFDCVSLAFPYLHCVSSRRGLIPADSSPLRRLRHAGLLRPFLLFELISRSPLIISLVACRHRCHFLLSFQNFPLFTLRPGCTSLSRRVRFHLKTDSIHLFIFRSF